MAQFYILTPKGIVYELDATTDMSYTLAGRTTDSPIEDGESVSDHYIQAPSVINFSGVITDVVSLSSKTNKLDTKGYIEGLIALKNSKIPFTVMISENLDSIKSCVFTSLNITNTGEFGIRNVGGNLYSAYKINFSVKQIRLAAAATDVVGVPQPDLQDMTQPAVESSQTTEQDESPSFLERASAAYVKTSSVPVPLF
jgi:hypothetical protein